MIAVPLLYGIACAVPAAYFTPDVGGHNLHPGSPIGLSALLLGWLPPYTIAWSANIPFLVGCVLFLMGRYRPAAYAGWAASALGLTTWALVINREIPYLLPGYYLWQASFVVLAVGARALAGPESKDRTPEV